MLNNRTKILITFTTIITFSFLIGCSDDGTGTDPDTGTLTGYVMDEESGEAVEGAMLQSGTVTATTGADGSYTMTLLPAGENSINIQHEYYETKIVELQILPDDTVTRDFDLEFGDLGKISGTLLMNSALPEVDFKVAVVGYEDTFDVADNGQFLTDFIPAGSLILDIIPEDHYFIERIDGVEVTRFNTTDLGTIPLRDLYSDNVIEENCFFGENDCLGFSEVSFAYTEPDAGCDNELIVDLGENEEAVPSAGLELEVKYGGVGHVSGVLRVSEDDNTFADSSSFYTLPEFTGSFDTLTGGGVVTSFDLDNTGMPDIRYLSFKFDEGIDEGRIYYIKVLNRQNFVD